MREPDKTELAIPDFALVVLIGSTGSGKSTFAAKHFLPTEVISSDRCRALVSDDETNQDVSADAFDLVREIAGKRLKHRKLTVIDATNVRAADRKAWVELARKWHALPIAIVIDPGVEVCVARNALRPDRDFGPGVPKRMAMEIRKGMGGLQREGFRQVWKLTSEESIDAAQVTRQPLWTDKRDDHGPFDITAASWFSSLFGAQDVRLQREALHRGIRPQRLRKIQSGGYLGVCVLRGWNPQNGLEYGPSTTAPALLRSPTIWRAIGISLPA